jgi:hypothetical protein
MLFIDAGALHWLRLFVLVACPILFFFGRWT